MIDALPKLGWTLFQFLWQGTLLTVVYAIIRTWLGRALSPQARYVLACGTLAAMALAPVLTFLYGPGLADGAELSAWPLPSAGTWDSLLPVFAEVWLCGAICFSIRFLGGWRMTVRLSTQGVRPAPDKWQRIFETLLARLRLSQPVRLLVSTLVDVPTVTGWLRPVVLIPAGALTGMQPELLEALLAHELAHIRRMDYLVNILQSAVEALLFYHPGVWWISDQIRAERELCCDDAAVAAIGDVLTYARALAELESLRTPVPAPALAASGASLVTRIRRLLSPVPQRNPLPGAAAALTMVVLWLAGVGAMAQASPKSPSPSTPTRQQASAEPSSPAPQPVIVAQNRIPKPPSLLLSPFGPQAPQPAPTARQPQAMTTPDPAKGGSITGVVVDKLTRKPLPKASIVALGGRTLQQRTGVSSTDGSFAIDDLGPADYRLTINARGYVSNSYGSQPGQNTTRLVSVEDGKAQKLEIEMVPQAVISGRVVTRSGEPVVNASIGAAQLIYPGGKPRLMSRVGNIFTNDRGEYRIPGLSPGTYYITSIYLRDLMRRDADGRRLPAAEDRSALASEALLPTIYPGVPGDTGAIPVIVNAGQEVQGINFAMLQASTVWVSGRVRNETGDPNAKISVELRRGGAFEGYVSDNASALRPDGTFELRNVQPGNYTLSVTSPIPTNRSMETALPLIVTDKKIADLDLGLTAGAKVPGRLRTEEEGDKNFQLSGHSVTLGWAGLQYVGRLAANASSAADGTFTLEHVNPGELFVTVAGMPPSYYIKSARLGSADILETGTTIASTAPGELDVVVSAKGAKVTGLVHDAKDAPVPMAQVVLVPDNPVRRVHAQWYRATNANASGEYTLDGIAPGVYKVFAWTIVPAQAWYNADFMRPLESKGVRVTVAESDSASVNLEVLP